jgi:hypothetical protein
MAFCFAALNAGNSNAARIAMMAITTSSSIKVKPTLRLARGSMPLCYQIPGLCSKSF